MIFNSSAATSNFVIDKIINRWNAHKLWAVNGEKVDHVWYRQRTSNTIFSSLNMTTIDGPIPDVNKNIKMSTYSIRIPIIKKRWPYDRLIFTMGIPVPGKTDFILRRGPERQ